MKKFVLAVSFLIVSQASADIFFSDMDRILRQYPVCEAKDRQIMGADQEFKNMYQKLKSDFQAGRRSSVEVPQFGMNQVLLKDNQTRRECSILIDGYDGRCYDPSCL